MLDENIKQNIKKCTRCAICTQNCPIYEIKKDENNCARGLICKLNGYEQGMLSEDEIKKDFKICLMCSKCENNCPSKIKTTKIFGYKNAKFYPSKINQKLFLWLKLLPLKIVYFLKKTKQNQNSIFYFKGCVNKAQHKTTFLDKMFYNPDFSCCALPYLAGGDIESYEKARTRNVELIKSSSLTVFDCASCFNTVKEYEELDEINKKKLVFFYDLLSDKKFKLKEKSKYKNKTVVFHKPCHITLEEYRQIKEFLKKIEGINFKELENPDTCCGFGGSYFVFHPLISTKIALKKAKTIKDAKADLILTLCPSCTLGLRYNQIVSLNFKKTLELRDFIEQELIET